MDVIGRVLLADVNSIQAGQLQQRQKGCDDGAARPEVLHQLSKPESTSGGFEPLHNKACHLFYRELFPVDFQGGSFIETLKDIPKDAQHIE